jgi:hypothetical protein
VPAFLKYWLFLIVKFQGIFALDNHKVSCVSGSYELPMGCMICRALFASDGKARLGLSAKKLE